jgi:hypothetical protein
MLLQCLLFCEETRAYLYCCRQNVLLALSLLLLLLLLTPTIPQVWSAGARH